MSKFEVRKAPLFESFLYEREMSALYESAKDSIEKDIIVKTPEVNTFGELADVVEELLKRKVSFEAFIATLGAIDRTALDSDKNIKSLEKGSEDAKKLNDVAEKMMKFYNLKKDDSKFEKAKQIIKSVGGKLGELKESLKLNESSASKYSKNFLEFIKNATGEDSYIFVSQFDNKEGKEFIESLNPDERKALLRGLLIASIVSTNDNTADYKEAVDSSVKDVVKLFPEAEKMYKSFNLWIFDEDEDKYVIDEEKFEKVCMDLEKDWLFLPDAEDVILNDDTFGYLNESKKKV